MISSSISAINFLGNTFNFNKARKVNEIAQNNFNFPSVWKKSHIEYYQLLEDSGYYSKELSQAEILALNNKIKKLNELAKLINNKLVACRTSYSKFINNAFEYYKNLVLNLKKFQTINCGEFSRIIYMILRLNNIKNSCIDIIKPAIISDNKSCTPIEHCLIRVKSNDDKYIYIDSLLNEIGSEEYITQIYTHKYSKCFQLNPNSKLTFLQAGSNTNICRNMPRINDDEAELLKKQFQNFIIDD